VEEDEEPVAEAESGEAEEGRELACLRWLRGGVEGGFGAGSSGHAGRAAPPREKGRVRLTAAPGYSSSRKMA
jgi:hypothetical protein